MNVDIEFFSDDALENIVTCLNYHIDKVIFVGYKEPMDSARCRNFAGLIKNVLNIKYVDFIYVEPHDLSDAMDKLEETVLEERRKGNTCYFDLTGGDNLILVAAGIIAQRHKVTMHQIDIATDELHEFAVSNKLESIADIKHETYKLSLSNYMKFRGTCINSRMHKDFKTHINNEEFVNDVKNLWNLCKRVGKKWNVYGKYFRSNTHLPNDALIESKYCNGDDIPAVYEFLKKLAKSGAITDLHRTDYAFFFRYKNKDIKDCLCDSGSILELYTYIAAMECNFFDSCEVGIHLDWDGTMDGWLPDVINEIDVLLIKNNIPTFISCKNGRLDRTALYELDTVTKKFGGKYAKKLIISSQNHDDTLEERAREMNIRLISNEIFDWTMDDLKEYLMDMYKYND